MIDEPTWLATNDALAMLDVLFPMRGLDSAEPQSRASRFYLFGCARMAWNRLPGVCRVIVEAGERSLIGPNRDRELREKVSPLAEALIHCRGSVDEVNAIGQDLVALGLATHQQVMIATDIVPELWTGFAYLTYLPFSRTTPFFRRVPAFLHSAALVREVFGNPFAQQPPFNPNWRTENVLQVANHVEATGDFQVLPILADALEDAGCTRDDVLRHCRCGEPHARGCWALELVLHGR
jgi:hypothetical protein